jgi:phosphoesterase RecJ-like protein
MGVPTVGGEVDLAGRARILGEIREAIGRASTITIAGHIRPDGDCLGSGLGLLHVVEAAGKKARFFTPGPIPKPFQYLPGFDRIETSPPDWSPDLAIYVDSADADRVLEGWYPQGVPVINIDHHISNPGFADINWVDSECAAAAEMIYWLQQSMGGPMPKAAAVCLFTGLMTDTGGFRFSNTSAQTLEIASKLAAAGANPGAIAEAVFDSRPAAQVRLGSAVMGDAVYELGGRFAWSSIDQARMRAIGAEGLEPEGFSNELRGIEGVEVGILFSESPEGWLRIGLRGRGVVNLSELAQILGGGGHRNASGAYVKESYSEAFPKALATCREWLASRLA